MEENNIVVKKEYNSLSETEIIRFGNEFLNEFIFNDEASSISINAFRIVAKIASDLRNSNFSDKQVQQLSLFDTTFKNEMNTCAKFTFKKSDIAVSRNYRNLENALEFLLNYKKGWYTVTNLKGEKLRSYGALLKDVTHSKGYISLTVPVYWLEKFTYLPSYNTYLYSLIDKTKNNKHIFFYLWLKTTMPNGTVVHYNNLNNRYSLKYKNASDLAKGFLKPIKIFLDTYADASFNYKRSGDSINITPYHNSKGNLLSEKTAKKVSLSQSTHYWSNRHKLNKVQKLKLKKGVSKPDLYLFERAYKSFVKDNRLNKIKSTSIVGDDFITKFQEFVIIEYSKTPFAEKMPNGYPIL